MYENSSNSVFRKKEFIPINPETEFIGKRIISCACRVHNKIGPGLLEKVYEVCLSYELNKEGLFVQRQLPVPIVYDNITFDEGFRLDLLVEKSVVCELKAVDQLNPVWKAQVISHLKLTGKRLGYLINFNVANIRQGIFRFVN